MPRKTAQPKRLEPKRLTAILTHEERAAQVAEGAKTALSSTAAAEIQHLSLEQVCKVKAMAGHGDRPTVWETSPELFPSGIDSLWYVDIAANLRRHLRDALEPEEFDSVLADAWYPQFFENAVLSLARYALLCRLGPSALAPIGDSLDVTSIAKTLYHHTSKMAAHSIIKAIQGEGREGLCFARLTMDDLPVGKNISQADQKPFMTELRRMQHLARGGYWNDTPEFTEVLKKVTPSKSKRREHKSTKKRPSPHLPFPDKYVSEMGNKSSWLIENLGPSLVACLKSLESVWRDGAQRGLKPAPFTKLCQRHLEKVRWIDAAGAEITQLPFKVMYVTQADAKDDADEGDVEATGKVKVEPDGLERDPKDGAEVLWPPRTFWDVVCLTRALQGAHMFVTSLATAPRNGETITFSRSCVRFGKDGRYRARGRTFKLVRQVGGIWRDWLLPEFAAISFEQQSRLVAAFEKLSAITELQDPSSIPAGNHLWGRIGSRRGARTLPISATGPNSLLRSFARALGMDLEPGGQTIRIHRFRKTLARLAALALTQAPKILMDVFGHKSIEMTMYYILTDKDLAAEIQTVERELRIMAAERAIHEMIAEEESTSLMDRLGVTAAQPASGPGGRAKETLRTGLTEFRIEVHRRGQDFGAASVREFASIFTMQGRTFQFVRPGVACTKQLNQAGPCNKKKGHPEPSRCSSKCDYRFEESWLRREVDEGIAYALEHYRVETDAGRDLVAGGWAAQVRANINRFDDLKEKWMRDPLVQSIVKPKEVA